LLRKLQSFLASAPAAKQNNQDFNHIFYKITQQERNTVSPPNMMRAPSSAAAQKVQRPADGIVMKLAKKQSKFG
jgi:hypothetical protein